ncbi:hypothetical protein SAMN05421788_11497 [Filimonas lacunae]|uniref:Uncharacterized protein n=1 Tax=Filimonas lacunae TaxID=477680 RepID=A0A173MM19_9BACT|nr:hypothetical protein [Filimonas lacunae]BAV08510.1 hypothetical protein FLA_4551 [Filimonas lacunae]SIT34051.1 hypothetical protein SAMN05421788_11497 [Filimonas lacunae]
MARNDIKDSAKDEAKLKPEVATIDLPDVEDIPGQEHVRPAPLNGIGDVTISSGDEEGKRILENDDDLDESDVTPEEKELLQQTSESMSSDEDLDVRNARVDNRDEDGELLNEDSLDVPGSEDDDENEEIGEEDEENNEYSLGDNR